MKKLKIVEYPDKRLKQKSKEVVEFNEDLHKLLDSMYPMMIDTNGIGLAAVQVGFHIRALILNIPNEDGEQPKENLLEIINPVILKEDGQTTYQEGCLSVPTFYEDIKRYKTISIDYKDRYGKEQHLDADELLSIAIQHEIDHLDGILFIDRLSSSRRRKFEKEYKKMLKDNKKS